MAYYLPKPHQFGGSWITQYPDGSTNYSSSVPSSGSETSYRVGNNTLPIHPQVKRERQKPPLVWRSVKIGIKSSSKPFRWSKKVGGFVYKPYDYIYVQRLVPDYSQFKRKPKQKKNPKKFTAPNYLSFRKAVVIIGEPTGSAKWAIPPIGVEGSVSGFLLGATGSHRTEGFFSDGFNFGDYATGTNRYPSYNGLLSELDSQARAKLYSKVKAQEVNVAQLLAERKQTAGLIADGLERAVKAAALLRRGRIGRAFTTLLPKNRRELASVPLVVNFGLKPLMSDIEGLTKELQRDPVVTRVVKSVASRVIDEVILDSNNVSSNGIMRAKTHVRVQGVLTVRYVATLEVSSFLESTASRLGLTNGFSVLWELTPWSFVVDWALPIGNYLNNTDAFWGWKVVNIHKTVFFRQTVTGERTLSGNSNGWAEDRGSGSQSFTTTLIECNREILNEPPGLPLPRPRNPISLTRVNNLLALFNQNSFRKK